MKKTLSIIFVAVLVLMLVAEDLEAQGGRSGERASGERASGERASGERASGRLGRVNRNLVNRRFQDRYRHALHRPFHSGWRGWQASRWQAYRRHHWWHGQHRPGYWWRWATAGAVTGWIVHGWTNPIYYDYGYGGNVYYEGDTVYVDNQLCCSSQEYYQEACAIAENVPEIDEEKAEDIDWLPLGVFAVVQEGVEDGNLLLQLAVSKEGIIAGTLLNESTESVRPVEGTVDKDTQRAAWTFVDSKNSDVVMETGIYNLTQDKTSILVHFGPGVTQTWTLVRLEPVEGEVPEEAVPPPPGP